MKVLQYKKQIIYSSVLTLLLIFLSQLLIRLSFRVADIISQDVGEVLAQWKDASVHSPILILVLSSVIFFFWSLLCEKVPGKFQKIILYFLGVIIFLILFAATFFLTKVNEIPMYTVLTLAIRLL